MTKHFNWRVWHSGQASTEWRHNPLCLMLPCTQQLYISLVSKIPAEARVDLLLRWRDKPSTGLIFHSAFGLIKKFLLKSKPALHSSCLNEEEEKKHKNKSRRISDSEAIPSILWDSLTHNFIKSFSEQFWLLSKLPSWFWSHQWL